MLPYGYLTMMVLATVPPIFKRIMAPKLREWDENFADSAERDHAKKYGYDKLALSA
jgi:alkane 1-monooxygenase